jgi:hypothetical protein
MGLTYSALLGPKVGDFAVNLVFIQEESPFPVAFYSAVVQDSLIGGLQDPKQIQEDFLLTDEGKDYFRWEITHVQQGVTYHQVLYFFESGDWKLVITYTRLNDQGAENDALVEAAMKTVRYRR